MRLQERSAELFRSIRERSFSVCCAVILVIFAISFFSIFKIGCSVIVDGEIIGTAPSAKYVEKMITDINENYAPYFNGSNVIDAQVTTTPKAVLMGRFTDAGKLAEKFKSTCPYLEDAFSILSNGKTVVAFESEQERRNAYEKFISQYADYSDTESYKVLDDVQFVHEAVPYGMIKSGDKAVDMLNRTYNLDSEVEISGTDKLDNLLKKFCMSKSELLNLNPKFKEGKTTKINVRSEIPYIRVMTTSDTTETQIIDYSTKTKNDDNLYEGETSVQTEGKSGYTITDKNVVCINGKHIIEKIIDSKTTDATDEILVVGTKPVEKGNATGSFDRPYNGSLSSRYGQRWGREHRGIDITGNIGDAITASDGGEVVYADWEEGYGNVVKINHKNGYTTLYAHCSTLCVKKGDKVAKGDKIAELGNTGRSTGPHVHFEVIDTATGNALNPLEYVYNE